MRREIGVFARSVTLAVVLSALVFACTSNKDNAAPPGTGTAPAVGTVPVAGAGAAKSALTYVPLDGRTFVQENVADGWINRTGGPDMGSIWNHGWDIWSALNHPTGQVLDGTPLPVWETWFSEGDVFLTREEVDGADSRDLNPPTQSLDAGDLATADPSRNAATVLTFNRYNREMRDHVLQNRYFDSATITGLQNGFDLANTPTGDRTISEFPNTSVMLKPVWWIVPGDKASEMPYWAGEGPDVATDQRNPDWKTWKQCVVVDPTGSARKDIDRTCNEGQAGQTPMAAGSYDAKTIDLDPKKSDFYAFKLTDDEVKGMAQFKMMLDNSNFEGKADEVKAGDYALLVAMHVSTREIPDWTWQTFWWSPHPSQVAATPPDAQAPPASLAATGVPKALSQFQMCSAYFMANPSTAPGAGEPFRCFNPYLETNLKGLYTPDRSSNDDVGIHSNCMSCHIVAKKAPGVKTQYASAGFISTDSTDWFGAGVRMQFSWALVSHAHGPPFVAPVPPNELPPAPTDTPGTTPGTKPP